MGYLDDALGDCGCSSGSQLGDIICTPSEAQAGEDALKRLRNVFASIGSPTKWRPYVDDLNKRWAEYDARWFKSVAWCDAKQIGVEATALLNRMAADPGGAPAPGGGAAPVAPLAPPPAPDPLLQPGPSSNLPSIGSMGTALAVGALALGTALALKNNRNG